MDIATIIVLGKALLKADPKREVIPRKITLPVPIFTFFDPKFIARKDVVPQCAFGEKLTWIPGQEKYVCLPSLK